MTGSTRDDRPPMPSDPGANGEREALIERLRKDGYVSRDLEKEFKQSRDTPGARAADALAALGGSWPFIGLFILVLAAWTIGNGVLLGRAAFDPYPFILLNLFLSMLAAFQAPVILMSQNRAAARDRLNAAHDYEVNLKAELEIQELHAKIDELRQQQWDELIQIQKQQLQLLETLLAGR